MKSYCWLLFFLALFSAGTAAGYTREDVIKRGSLRCGVSQHVPGFAELDAAGRWTGFDTDICRAVAAAVLGSAEKVTFVPMGGKGAYTALLTGEVDLLLLHQPDGEWSFVRDSALAVNFTAPSFYDKPGLMVKASLYKGDIDDLDAVSCIPASSKSIVPLFLTRNSIRQKGVIFPGENEALRAFLGGECGMVFGTGSVLQGLAEDESSVVLTAEEGRLLFGPIVRQGDDNWFTIVRWSLLALLDAEVLGFSSRNVEEMRLAASPEIKRFFGYVGDGGKNLGLADDWAAQIIIQVGNYAEIFARNLGAKSALKRERGRNRLWRDGGLHCPPPLR